MLRSVSARFPRAAGFAAKKALTRFAKILRQSNRRKTSVSILRSEERRVGKECISRCDWSSDVCSSDLGTISSSCGICGKESIDSIRQNFAPIKPAKDVRIHLEIGRASCRERVYISV